MALLFEIIDIARRELLLFSAIWLLVGGLDDLCVDLIWIGRKLYRRQAYYHNRAPLLAHQLAPSANQGLLAIFIPAWGEASVIGAMLDHCTRSWRTNSARIAYMLDATRMTTLQWLPLCGRPPAIRRYA